MAFHDSPSLAELVEAVREWLQATVIDGTEPLRTYDARVAVRILAMVERQAVLESVHEARHEQRLGALGVRSDRELAARIRRGSLDGDAFDGALAALLAATVDRLEVANPSYVDKFESECEAGYR